jgi:error-prone DNA polymerase
LILAGTMDGWEIPRRKLLWELGRLRYREEELDLVFPADEVELPSLSRAEAFSLEWEVLGLSTGEHALAFYRSWLRRQGILGSSDLAAQPAGRRVRIAGQIVVHQSPPTAKGHHFLTLEDEAGLVQVILRPAIYERYERLVRTVSLLIVEGTVQQQDGVINLLAGRVMALAPTGGAPAGLPGL